MSKNSVPDEHDHENSMAGLSAAIKDKLGSEFLPEPTPGIQRFAAPDKSANNKACWVRISDNLQFATCGSFITGETHKWQADEFSPVYSGSIDEASFTEINSKGTDPLADKRNEKLAAFAKKIVAEATPAHEDHPYLLSKGVKPIGLKQRGQVLIVPLFDVTNEVCGVQQILNSGKKFFLSGGSTKGLFARVGEIGSTNTLFVSEGWATAATLHEETGHPVIAAMTANNLLPVCEAIADAVLKSVTIVVAADNDHRTDGNPGMTKAREAAKAIGAMLTFPPVPCKAQDCRCTDFNDWHQCSKRLGVPNE